MVLEINEDLGAITCEMKNLLESGFLKPSETSKESARKSEEKDEEE